MMKYSLGLLIFCFLICNDALLAQDDNFDALGETSAALNHKVSKLTLQISHLEAGIFYTKIVLGIGNNS